MARQRRIFGSGLLYHVIARGNDRQATFLGDDDYRVYLKRLARYRDRWHVTLYAYCLMPNHVHLLARTNDAPLAKFMQGLQQSYTQGFNRAHSRVGHLFQGRYRAIVCDSEAYLIALVRYIHLNPVRAGLVKRPEDYPYSGHGVYLDGVRGVRGAASDLVDPALVLELLGGRQAYRRFVLGGLDDGHREDYYRVTEQQLLGPPEFVERMRGRPREEPERRTGREPLDAVVQRLGREVGLDTATLGGPDRRWPVSRARALVAHVLVRTLGYPVGEVARAFSRAPGTVSALIGSLDARIESDEAARGILARLCNMV